MPNPRDSHSRYLLDLSSLLAGGNAAVTFFDPSGGSAQDGVFPTLLAAVNAAKLQAGAGQPAEVVVVPQVDTDGVDIVILVTEGPIGLEGRVALSNGLVIGSGRRPVLDFAEGVVITGARELRNLDLQKNDGATPVFQWTGTADDGAIVPLKGSRLSIGGTATGPLATWDHGAADFMRFNLTDTTITKDQLIAVGVMASTDGSGNTTIDTLGGAIFDPNVLETAIGHDWGLFFEADTVFQPQALLFGAGFAAAGGSGPDSLDGQDYDARKAGGITYWTKAQTFQPGYRSRTVLVREQLEQSNSLGSSGMINPAAVMYQPAAAAVTAAVGDTFSIARDVGGSVSETWTAVAAGPGAFEFAVGADWGESVANLADAIIADSTAWGAVKAFNLRAMGGSGATVATFKGVALVVYRLSSVPAYDDRIFADFTTSGAVVRTVDYSKFGLSYSADNTTAPAVIPTTDPGSRFGFGYGTFGPADQGQAVYVIESGVIFQASIGFGLSGTFQGGWSPPAYDVTEIAIAPVVARAGQTVRFDPSGGAFIISIEDTGPAQKGAPLEFKNVTADVTAVTINAALLGGHTIDGAATAVIAAARGTLVLRFDGVSDWMIF